MGGFYLERFNLHSKRSQSFLDLSLRVTYRRLKTLPTDTLIIFAIGLMCFVTDLTVIQKMCYHLD